MGKIQIKLARREIARCCVSAGKFYEILSPHCEIELRIPSRESISPLFSYPMLMRTETRIAQNLRVVETTSLECFL